MPIEIPGLSESLSPISEGTYAAQVASVSEEQSSTGRPMITVSFTLLDEPYAGRKVFDRFLKDHPVGVRRFASLLRALGVQANGDVVDPEELVGLPVRVTIIHEQSEFSNNILERVKRYDKAF